ncbi:MAG: hypothetical protein IKZ28_00560 [Clostridia bacterium]|nr:hypothetical protein [Clostridia bacterium]
MGLHDGHRTRMYEKLEKGNLAEHEWLEVLLYNGLPRRNTNELAHRLIDKFGSTALVLSASVKELCKVEGVGLSVAGYLHTIGRFFEEYTVAHEPQFEGCFSHEKFLPFVKKVYASHIFEVIDIYLLTGEGSILGKKRFTTEDFFTASVAPEKVTNFILTEGAVGVVLVHNHPHGHCKPSDADYAMTKKLQMLCNINNRLLCDHFIYAPTGVYSFYLSEDMIEINREYLMSNLLKKQKGDS